MTLRILDLFSGIGGFSYAAENIVGGFETKQFVEIDSFCQKVLRKHWPNVPIHSDVCTFTAAAGSFDVICGGFPCQDLSTAGKQAGLQGHRSGLFFEIMRLAREIQPRFIVIENVANLRSHSDGETFQEVLWEIASAGFNAEWACIPAADVGACHKRDRIWIVAYPKSQQRHDRGFAYSAKSPGITTEFRNGNGENVTHTNNAGLERWKSIQCQQSSSEWPTWQGDSRFMLSNDWRSFVSKPVIRRGDDGFSGRVDRLKALGNAVVPYVAAVALNRVKHLAQDV
jgi:DNA (cytosine-5)-methyltransferase 1